MTAVRSTGARRSVPFEDRVRLQALLASARDAYLDQFEALTVRESTFGVGALDEVDQRVSAQAARELGEIEAALHRIAVGTYGCCESCARAIPVERLYARPHARFCLPCHSRRR